MKRVTITILVILGHIIAISALYYGCHADSDSEIQDPEKRNSSSGSSNENDDSRGLDQDADSRQSSTTKAEDSTPGLALKKVFTPSDFDKNLQNLPASIRDKTKHCKAGIMVNLKAKKIIWQKNASQASSIASMTKMMTALVLMEEIEENPGVSLSTQVGITKEASAIGGRQVYLDPREKFSLDELLKCMMVFSANDAAYQVAQFIGEGNVDDFMKRMNDLAAEMGLQKTTFNTPHGLPGDNGRHDKSTPLELACIGATLMQYPEVTKWSSTRLDYIRENSSRFDRFQLLNTNKLITSVPGVNGLKTGYTDKAGYCITATYKKAGKSFVVVLMGCPSSSIRNNLAEQLFKWQTQPGS